MSNLQGGWTSGLLQMTFNTACANTVDMANVYAGYLLFRMKGACLPLFLVHHSDS